MRFRPPQIVAAAGAGKVINDLVTDINRVLVRLPQETPVKAERVALQYAAGSTIDANFSGIPKNSQILAFEIDNAVPWSAGSTAVLTIGTTAAGTQYLSATNVKATTGKISPAHTTAQLDAMDNVGENQSVWCRITLTGSHSVGDTRVTMWYK